MKPDVFLPIALCGNRVWVLDFDSDFSFEFGAASKPFEVRKIDSLQKRQGPKL